MKRALVQLSVNGDRCSAVVSSSTTLAEMLRDELLLTGTKVGCGTGDCGACTVLLNGRSVNSCLTLALEADGAEVTTIEGIAPSGDRLHPVQEAFIRLGAVQCGFCTPGMVVSAVELVESRPGASEAEIRHALGGHLCRCTGYTKIVEAVAAVARGAAGEPDGERSDA